MKKLFQKLRHSLSIRLILLFVFTGIIIASIEIYAVSQAIKDGFESSLKPHFKQYTSYLLEDIGTPPDLEKARQLTDKLPIEMQITGQGMRWTSRTEGFIDPQKLHTHEHAMINGVPIKAGRLEGEKRFILSTRVGSYDFLFLLPTRPDNPTHRYKGLLLVGALLLTLFITYRVIRRMIYPLTPIRQGIQRIGNGELSHRIHLSRHDELGELGDSIDLMADDIEKLLESKRQLLLAISHELRTPITRAKVSLELLTDDKTRARLDSDLQEMSDLINLLIEGERLKEKHNILSRQPTDIDQLVKDIVNNHYSEESIQLSLTEQDSYLMIDPVRVQLLLKNLIDNALRFNRIELGPIEIQIKIVSNQLVFKIKDHGTGIPQQHIEHVVEPFYRVDESRQRKTGSFGLGLYLCNMIAQSHGGELTIESDHDGTLVFIRLKLDG